MIQFQWHGALPVRDHIPLEQGLRPNQVKPHYWLPQVRDHIPLEQGLRQNKKNKREGFSCQRPYSIRTRIKTMPTSAPRQRVPKCQRPYSIRTRIKTARAGLSKPPPPAVRDHIPLEQGLRLMPC